jgi:hypothetical protein
MATKKISALTSLAQDSIDPAADVIPINDTSAVETKKATAAAIVGKSIGALAATWNNALTTFKARVFNVTDTASAAASLLDDLQVGGVSKWSVRKDGALTVGSVPVGRITENDYGAFSDVTDQTAVANTATGVIWGTTDYSSGISVASNTRITVTRAGIYKFDFNLLLKNTNSSSHIASFWLRKNGSDVANSNTDATVPAQGGGIPGTAVVTIVFTLQLAASDYIEVIWSTPNVAVTLDFTAAQTSPTRPVTPSVIANINRIA